MAAAASDLRASRAVVGHAGLQVLLVVFTEQSGEPLGGLVIRLAARPAAPRLQQRRVDTGQRLRHLEAEDRVDHHAGSVDAAHPERGYVAPRAMGNPNIGDGQSPGGMGTGEYGNAMDFRMKFRLPAGVSGDRCLIQWRYITGNSCEMPGYDQVAWPSQAWRNAGLAAPSAAARVPKMAFILFADDP